MMKTRTSLSPSSYSTPTKRRSSPTRTSPLESSSASASASASAPIALVVTAAAGNNHHHGVVRITSLPSRKGMFLLLITVALLAGITFIRNNGFLHEMPEPYVILSRVTMTTTSSAAASKSTSSTDTASSTLSSTISTVQDYDYDGPSRVWKVFNNGTFPCYRGERHLMSTEPAHHGFLFHRPMKVGSTTMVGIVLRLVHNKATETFRRRKAKCMHRAMHGSALDLEYDRRDLAHSFLFTLVRHPTQRAISEFFHFRVSSAGIEPTDVNFLHFVRRQALRNFYLKDMTMKAFDNSTYGPDVASTPLNTIVQDILGSFDFMAVTERMNESLVVMQMLLGLSTKDILYTRARTSGTFSNGPSERPCIYIMPSFLTTRMKSFFESEEWQDISRGDLLLYQAANASLDRTIDALGRKEFDQKLQALERGLLMAEDNCRGDRIVTLCTEGGERIAPSETTCYIWSEGCDHDCIDELEDIE